MQNVRAVAAKIVYEVVKKQRALDDVLNEKIARHQDMLKGNRISGLAQVDPSSLDFPRGGEEKATGVYNDIHDCRERRCQQSGIPKCEGYMRDQALLQELCYGCLRWYHKLDAISRLLFKKATREDNYILHILVFIGLYQILYLRVPTHAAVYETVNAVRYIGKPWGKALLNGILRNFLRNQPKVLGKIEHDAVAAYSHPRWFIDMVQRAWPQKFKDILCANNQYPPMHLRVNLQKIQRADYIKLLVEKHIGAAEDQFTDTGITLHFPQPIAKLPGFEQGLVFVQDLASQLAANLLELKPNVSMLDACAAPGGKLTHILESGVKLAKVVGLDIEKLRLAKVEENLQRLHLSATLMCGDALKPRDWWDGKQFERILLDAPCSASGIIRRHPDIKVLRQSADIGKLVQRQRDLLEALWPLLKPGGILLYSTCSIFPQENADNIEHFLQKHTDAQEKKIDAVWGCAVKYGRQIITGDHNMDGFYYARLEKHDR
jgi:16S rRNA (cytosine967-C5)-methyltransferase